MKGKSADPVKGVHVESWGGCYRGEFNIRRMPNTRDSDKSKFSGGHRKWCVKGKRNVHKARKIYNHNMP